MCIWSLFVLQTLTEAETLPAGIVGKRYMDTLPHSGSMYMVTASLQAFVENETFPWRCSSGVPRFLENSTVGGQTLTTGTFPQLSFPSQSCGGRSSGFRVRYDALAAAPAAFVSFRVLQRLSCPSCCSSGCSSGFPSPGHDPSAALAAPPRGPLSA